MHQSQRNPRRHDDAIVGGLNEAAYSPRLPYREVVGVGRPERVKVDMHHAKDHLHSPNHRAFRESRTGRLGASQVALSREGAVLTFLDRHRFRGDLMAVMGRLGLEIPAP